MSNWGWPQFVQFIDLSIYLSVQWDEREAQCNPGWRVMHTRNSQSSDMGQLVPTWHSLCISNRPYLDRLIAQSREVIDLYQPAGILYDILVPFECVCQNCLDRMERDGRDPLDCTDRLENHLDLIDEYYHPSAGLRRPPGRRCRRRKLPHGEGTSRGDRPRDQTAPTATQPHP